ncbi:hypothetical protein WM46_18260 [Citrobacter freundii complex sp. CFNIH2]|uniref:hypothetical protein n=1 Tax=Citrobacter freundii complex sp. CFNIH2 TaxID=2066049 RepID=UPI000C868B5B|nr:hypothetical protein [Citrobacter freundii complex sp. CFNIH2]AUO66528.1 hypothetical protein WM46_18260 [Citrobacter freundii complex sp. CFNIH2]
MNKRYLVVLIMFIVSLLFLGGLIYRIFTHGELANKPFYVLLQGFAERSEYNSPFTLNKEIVPVFIKQAINYKGQSYDILGISTKNEKSPYFWIITNTHENAEPPDYVFSISEGTQFYLSCNYLDRLEKKERIDNMVSEFLRKHCINDEKLSN